ncbi:MAG: cytochrome C [Proteobacteria bacterium]|nr:cytochrome C [Pseudomonadota bacterium]
MSGKRMSSAIIRRAAVIASLSFAIWGCAQTQPAPAPLPPTTAQAEPAKTVSAEEKALIEAQVQTELQNTDCSKCHDTQPADIKRNGGKHQTEIGCLDCHLEHLPLGTKTIPQCSMCHAPDTQEHFKLPNCLECHRNPHTPLDVTVDDVPPISAGCKTCHPEKGEELAKFPSKHTALNCTFCHPTKHKQIKKCLECHTPHADFMVYEDCLACHQPHSPLNIQYADETPSKNCGACHDTILSQLLNSKAKHGELTCAFCHKTKHPTVPNCSDCHKNPHDNAMMSTFNSECLKCHRNPHDLIY